MKEIQSRGVERLKEEIVGGWDIIDDPSHLMVSKLDIHWEGGKKMFFFQAKKSVARGGNAIINSSSSLVPAS